MSGLDNGVHYTLGEGENRESAEEDLSRFLTKTQDLQDSLMEVFNKCVDYIVSKGTDSHGDLHIAEAERMLEVEDVLKEFKDKKYKRQQINDLSSLKLNSVSNMLNTDSNIDANCKMIFNSLFDKYSVYYAQTIQAINHGLEEQELNKRCAVLRMFVEQTRMLNREIKPEAALNRDLGEDLQKELGKYLTKNPLPSGLSFETTPQQFISDIFAPIFLSVSQSRDAIITKKNKQKEDQEKLEELNKRFQQLQVQMKLLLEQNKDGVVESKGVELTEGDGFSFLERELGRVAELWRVLRKCEKKSAINLTDFSVATERLESALLNYEKISSLIDVSISQLQKIKMQPYFFQHDYQARSFYSAMSKGALINRNAKDELLDFLENYSNSILEKCVAISTELSVSDDTMTENAHKIFSNIINERFITWFVGKDSSDDWVTKFNDLFQQVKVLIFLKKFVFSCLPKSMSVFEKVESIVSGGLNLEDKVINFVDAYFSSGSQVSQSRLKREFRRDLRGIVSSFLSQERVNGCCGLFVYVPPGYTEVNDWYACLNQQNQAVASVTQSSDPVGLSHDGPG
jgi:hypothetical protein